MQTSLKMSPVRTVVQDGARRQLRSECLNFWLRHRYSRSCKASLSAYNCNGVGCAQSILVASRGQTPQVSPTFSVSSQASSSTKGPSSAAVQQPAEETGQIGGAWRPQTSEEEERPTFSAHPARFSPDDKYSDQRIKCKKRFHVLKTQEKPLDL